MAKVRCDVKINSPAGKMWVTVTTSKQPALATVQKWAQAVNITVRKRKFWSGVEEGKFRFELEADDRKNKNFDWFRSKLKALPD